MQRLGLTLLVALFTIFTHAQLLEVSSIEPDSLDYENVYVKALHTDTFQSTYVIWVRDEVPPHYHANHTEYIHVVAGSGTMQLGDSVFTIRPGDAVIIPAKSIHAVKTNSDKPLKVVSVQAPKFDGDRVWVEK